MTIAQKFDYNACKLRGKGKNSTLLLSDSILHFELISIVAHVWALVVLISADKNLKVSGLLLGEELPQSWLCCAFCPAPYFHSWKVEKMQRHMHRWSRILIGTQLFVSEWKFTLFSILTAAIIVENLKLELAREYIQTGGGTIWGTGWLAQQTLANKTLDDWDAA